MYAGNEGPDAPPSGWLYCNGDTISSTINDGGTNLGGTHYNADGKGNDYQPLFNLLSAAVIWGNSSSASWGSDKVKLPDFRSRSPVGVATGAANMADARVSGGVTTNTGTALAAGLTSRAISVTVGTETHALVTAELAAHTHSSVIVASATGQTINNPTHVHAMPTHIHTMPTHTHSTPGSTTSTIGAHSHGITGYTAYNGTTGLGLPKKTTVEYGTAHASTSTDSGGSHAGLTVPSGTSGSTDPGDTNATDPGDTNATAPSITLTDPNHTHTLTAASTGSGTAHTNLSPIIAVNYIIKV
jgi:microcystin-dependent protein